jgi:hypothetical protein
MKVSDLDYKPKINIAESTGFFKILDEAGVGKIVKGVNTTADVQPGEIRRQSAKMGSRTSNNGYPPVASPNGKFNPIKMKRNGR